jgi:phosphate/sulfate permease
MRPETRWAISIAVGVLSMIGMLILVALVSLALEPPTWVQILLGIGLVLGGVLMTFLVATALSSHDQAPEKSGPRSVKRATSD